MTGVVEDVPHGALLDDPSGIHDGDPVGRFGDDAEVVRDQQQRELEPGLQIPQEIQNLRLERRVEHRGRLVGDEQRRPAGERDGDHDPLAQAAGQLVRVVAVPAVGIRHPDRGEQLDHGLP